MLRAKRAIERAFSWALKRSKPTPSTYTALARRTTPSALSRDVRREIWRESLRGQLWNTAVFDVGEEDRTSDRDGVAEVVAVRTRDGWEGMRGVVAEELGVVEMVEVAVMMDALEVLMLIEV